MPTVYFGQSYNFTVLNGNWNDVGQWFSADSYVDGEDVIAGVPLGRLPYTSETISFKQAVLSNFPSSWSGDTMNLQLGREYGPAGSSQRINATGTWSGYHICDIYTGGIRVCGTSTQPVISGTVDIFGGSVTFNGGLVTGNIISTNGNQGGSTTFLGDSRYTAGGTFSFQNWQFTASNTAYITANFNTSSCAMYLSELCTINGTVSVGTLYALGGTKIINSPTIQTLSYGQIYIRRGTSGASATLSPTFPQTTLIKTASAGDIFLGINYNPHFDSDYTTDLSGSSFNIQCGGNLTIENCVFPGNFVFTYAPRSKLSITYNSVIATDISTPTTNCYDYTLNSGTYTNSNDFIFGSSTTAANVKIGCNTHFNYSPQPYITTIEKLDTNKNITIYSNSTKSVYFNYASNGLYNPYNNDRVDPLNFATFGGLINILTTTGGTAVTPSVQGGRYTPTKTIPAYKTGSDYRISAADFPSSYGFGLNGSSSYSPTLFISNLPSGIDVLAASV